MALYLPDAWNTRFMATGNGGFGGFTAWSAIGQLSQYGFATVSTDTGHLSGQGDASWALNNPETLIDWGWRALHMSVVLGKDLTASYYDSDLAYSYYAGCSTGGRQGLKEVQEFPEDFDGALVGAPAWWTTHQQTYAAWVGQQNLPSTASYHITTAQVETVVAEMLVQCDPQDGLTDLIIQNPDTCRSDPSTLLCTSANTSSTTCFPTEQMHTLQKIVLNDWVDANQTFIFPAYSIGADPSFLVAVDSVPSVIGTTYLLNMVFNSSLAAEDYDWSSLGLSTIELADATNAGQPTADNYDLSPFEAKGGKLIHYHGFADPQIATKASIYYHSQVMDTMTPMGVNVSDFYRLFTIPGMQHCSSSQVAPWYIGAAGQSIAGAASGVPGYNDAKHDAILSIMAWTENGTAPDYLIATKFINDDATAGVSIQRPLCPYPSIANYISGDSSVASNWQCS